MMADIGRAIARALLGAMAALVLAAPAQATDDWETGRQLHIDNGCTDCHAAKFGNTLSDLNAAIAGVPSMAGFSTLTASQRSDIAAYLQKSGNYPRVSLSTATVNFATTAVGSTRTANVRVTNNGICDNPGCVGSSLNVSSAAASDGNYDVSPTRCSNIGIGSFCDLTVTFQPQSAGGLNGRSLTFSHNALGSSSSVTLNGTGEQPNFAISENSFDFVAKFNATAQRTFTITNSASVAALDLTGIAVDPPSHYARTGGSCTTVGANNVAAGSGTCTIIVEFTPGALGAAPAGTLTIGHNADNGPANPFEVGLTGTGTQATFSASSTSLDFATVQLGVPKALPAITITNTATDPTATLVFSSDPTSAGVRTGAGKDDYAVVSNCAPGNPVAANNGTCTITVTFTPTVLGARPATLTLASDATNTPLVVNLTGSGTALPEPAVTFPASDFPDTTIGETAAQTRLVTIVNDRTLDIGYSVPNTTDFNVVSESCPTHVVPGGGGSCTVTWRFQPQLAGGETRRTANVTFSFTGSGGNPAPSNVVGGLAGRALLPLGAPAALTPNAGFGLPATTSTLLSNRSATPITLSALSFSGAAAADYALDATNGCALASSIAAGSSCTLVVRFDPSTGGTRNATLTITHDALGSPQAIALNGSATQGAIQLTSFALSFGDTALNANATQTITVENAGTQALNFSALNLTGAAVGDYTRGGSCTAGTPLAVGALCTVAITFQPTALGARSASLTITSDASNGPATVTLSGTGVPIPAPVVTLAPTAIDFGAQTVGNSLYPTRVIRLSNTGNAPLASIAVSLTGAAYSTASVCPATLAPAAGCDIEIRFTPAAANTDYAGTLRVTSNAAGSPHTAALAGRGTAAVLPALVWSPAVTSLDFGIVSSGTVSAPQTATLLNQGPGGVELTVLNAIGPAATSFGIVGGSCAVGMQLFEGQSCTVQFAFAPASAGVRTASVQVASTGSFPPALALAGTGTGGPTPGATLSVAALDLGDTRVGSRSQPAEVTITSSGSGALQLTALAVDGPFVVQGGTCPALPHTLPAGSSCSVALMFLPQSEGAMTGTLRVTTDVPGAALEVALSGEAEAAADVSSGGCSMIDGDGAADPMLWLLVLLAVVALVWRRRTRRA
jgi:hypothetical protein